MFFSGESSMVPSKIYFYQALIIYNLNNGLWKEQRMHVM